MNKVEFEELMIANAFFVKSRENFCKELQRYLE